MMTAKVGRPGKTQFRCNQCKTLCAPKNGDWFYPVDSLNQQVFLCRSCEQRHSQDFKRTIPAR